MSSRILLNLYVLAVFFIPAFSDATIYTVTCLSPIVTPNSAVESGGHRLACANGVLPNSVPHPICGSSVYIAREDKEIFSVGLNAQTLGRSVTITYDDAKPSVTMYAPGVITIPCKSLGVYMNVN